MIHKSLGAVVMIAAALITSMCYGGTQERSLFSWGHSFSRPSSSLVNKIQYMFNGGCGAAAPLGVVTNRLNNEVGMCSDGTWVSVGNNALLTTDLGAQIFIVNTNQALWSEQFDSGCPGTCVWVPESDGVTPVPVVVGNVANGPDGSINTADSIAIPLVIGAGKYSAICQQINTGDVRTFTASVFSTAINTGVEGIPYVYMYNGATYYSKQLTASNTAWKRSGVVSTSFLTNATWKMCIGVDLRDAAQATQLAVLATIWGGQFEKNTNIGPYISTTTIPVDRAATISTLTNPLPTGQPFVVTIDSVDQWSTLNTETLFAFGTSVDPPTLRAIFTNKKIFFVTQDLLLNSRTWIASSPQIWANNSEHKISFAYNPVTGTLSVAADGTGVPGTFVGAGSVVGMYNSADVYLGTTSEGSNGLQGYLKSISFCWPQTSGVCQ